MKKCGALIGHSNSSASMSKRQDSSLFPQSSINSKVFYDWCDKQPIQTQQTPDSLSKSKNFKMPGLLRLNSVGESSSCSLLDKNRYKSRSRSATKVELPQTQNTVSPYDFEKPGVIMAALKYFPPVHQSTPNFKKSEGCLNTQQTSPVSTFGKRSSAGRKLFLNHSVPAPSYSSCGVVDTQQLCSSLSSPALSAVSVCPSAFVRQCSMSEPYTAIDITAEKDRTAHLPITEFCMQHMCQGLNSEDDKTKFHSSHRESGACTSVPSLSLGCVLNMGVEERKPQDQVTELASNSALYLGDEDSISGESQQSMNILDNSDVETSQCDMVREDSGERQKTGASFCTKGATSTPDRTFVLFQRKKCTKKGRPSSKKQKKRKREKQKQSDTGNGSEPSLIFSFSVDDGMKLNETKKEKVDVHVSFSSEASSVLDNSKNDVTFSSDKEVVNSPQVPKSPLKDHTGPSLACIFISGADVDSSSDSQSAEESDIDENWWSEEDDEECESNKRVDVNFCLGGALSLEDIFRKENVSSKCKDKKDVAGSPDSRPITFLVGSPGHSSHDESYHFSFTDSDSLDLSSSPILQSLQDSFGDFNQGLCMDSILGVVSVKAHPSKSFASEDSDNMRKINARWDEHYQSSGFRSCSGTDSAISNPAVKVHFADDSHLETVHEVGTEDRRGVWHIDRERFQQRIARAEEILSPVLNRKHRKAIYKRNLELEAALHG